MADSDGSKPFHTGARESLARKQSTFRPTPARSRVAAPLAVALAGAAAGALWAAVDFAATVLASLPAPLRAHVLVGHAALLVLVMIPVGGLFGAAPAAIRAALRGASHRSFRWTLALGVVVRAVLFGLIQAPALGWLWDRPSLASTGAKAGAALGSVVVSILLGGLGAVAWDGWHTRRRLATLVCALAAVVLFGAAHLPEVRLHHPLSSTATLVGLVVIADAAAASLPRGHFDTRRVAALLFGGFAAAWVAASFCVRELRVRSAIASFAMGGPYLVTFARGLGLWTPAWQKLPGDVSPGRTASSSQLVTPRAGVVIITIDSLRADRLPAYGGRRGFTPNLDRFFAGAVVFDRAYAQFPSTTGSLPSLHSGKLPWEPIEGWREVLAGRPTLARRLRARGYETAAFFRPWSIRDSAGFLSFDHVRLGFERGSSGLGTAPVLVQSGVEFLERASSPFLWVHVMEPHAPYTTHPEIEGGPTDPYENEIAFVDAALAPLLDIVGRRSDLIVWLTADHGEAFGEHGLHFHASSLYDEQIRVPLAVRVPGLPPRRVAGPIQLLDIAPTTLALVGAAAGDLDGHDRRSEFEGGPSVGPAFAVFGSRVTVATAQEKLTCDASSDSCELYDLTNDPGERSNLYGQDERQWVLKDALIRFVTTQEMTLSGGQATLEHLLRVRRTLERRMGDPAEAAELLRSGGAFERQLAAAMLTTTAGAAMAEREALERAASDGADGVRCWALAGLARLGDRVAGRRLAECDSVARANPRLRGWMTLARYEVDGDTSREELRSTLREHEDRDLVLAAISAIQRFQDERWRADLVHWLEDVDVAGAAATALLSLKPGAGFEEVASALSAHRATDAQIALIRALAESRSPSAYEALAAVAHTASDWAVLGEAMLALHQQGHVPADVGGAASSFERLPQGSVHRATIVLPPIDGAWAECWVGVSQPADGAPNLAISVNGQPVGSDDPSLPALRFMIPKDVLRVGTNTVDIAFPGESLPVRGIVITGPPK